MRRAEFILPLALALATAAVAGTEPSTRAEEAIPFSSLTATNRLLVKSVTDHYTLRRPYAAQTLTGQVTTLTWMLDNLQPTWQLAQRFGIKARATHQDTQGRFWNDATDGSTGYLMNVYRGAGKRIYYMEGSQKKICTVHGRGIIVVDFQAAGTNAVALSGAQFVKVDNGLLAAMTQLFGPFLCGIVDRTYQEFIEPLRVLSEVAATKPAQLRQTIRQMPVEAAGSFDGLTAILEPAAKEQPTTGPPR